MMTESFKNVKVISFDADDTLWENENYFREVELNFASLMEEYLPGHTVLRELLKTEIANMPYYGYGIKGFVLSMVETAIFVSNGQLPIKAIEKIMELGKEMINKPVILMPEIEKVLNYLKPKYKLIVATKGDLLDQERKLKKSSLVSFFHHIEIMSEKGEEDYINLIKHLDIQPQEFLMIGNSLKSDVIPVINLGGYAIHIPFHTTWELERIDTEYRHERFMKMENVSEILNHF